LDGSKIDEDPRDLKVLDDVNSSYFNPVKLQKINVVSEEHPKLASIGDY